MSQAETKLREVLSSVAEDKFPTASDVKIKFFSTQGANYTSALFSVTIVMPEKNVDIFAKVASMGDNVNATRLFNIEKFVYTTLSTAYEKLQDKHGLTEQRFIFPQYYKSTVTDATQIVMLENLTAKGYGCQDRFKNIDWKYASACVETLARYHALSFALRKEHPEEFERAGEALNMEWAQSSNWDGLTDGALAAVDEEDREKLSQLLEGSVGWNKFLKYGDPCKTPVIIHGDYKGSNLMHKEVNGKLHVIPIDYQTARLGCPASDLIYFIITGSDQQFRQQHFHQLVDHYYEQLALAMRRLGVVPEEVYGMEEFKSDMKEKLPISLCVAAMILPFITVDPANVPNFEDGQYVPRTNDLFAERFRGLMCDFKQWGFI